MPMPSSSAPDATGPGVHKMVSQLQRIGGRILLFSSLGTPCPGRHRARDNEADSRALDGDSLYHPSSVACRIAARVEKWEPRRTAAPEESDINGLTRATTGKAIAGTDETPLYQLPGLVGFANQASTKLSSRSTVICSKRSPFPREISLSLPE